MIRGAMKTGSASITSLWLFGEKHWPVSSGTQSLNRRSHNDQNLSGLYGYGASGGPSSLPAPKRRERMIRPRSEAPA